MHGCVTGLLWDLLKVYLSLQLTSITLLSKPSHLKLGTSVIAPVAVQRAAVVSCIVYCSVRVSDSSVCAQLGLQSLAQRVCEDFVCEDFMCYWRTLKPMVTGGPWDLFERHIQPSPFSHRINGLRVKTWKSWHVCCDKCVCICVSDGLLTVRELASHFHFQTQPNTFCWHFNDNLDTSYSKKFFFKKPSPHSVTWQCLKRILQYECIFPLKRKGSLETCKIFVALIVPFHLE